MPSWTKPISLRGLSVLAGDGPPTDSIGQFGSPGYIDLSNPDGPAFYGPKDTDGWPTTFVVLKGSDATLPKDIVGNSLVISPVDGDSQTVQIALKNSAGNTVFASDAKGNVLVGGTFSVADVATIATLNAGNINVSDLAVSDDASFMGALEVAGATTLQQLTAASAAVTGALSADSAQIGTLQTGSLSATGSLTTPILNVTKTALMADASMVSLTVGTPAKAGQATINGPLQVSGLSTLDDIQAGDIAAGSLSTSGSITTQGALQGASLAVLLPASGAAQTPLQLTDASGRVLFSVSRDGDASILGTLVVAGAQTSEATNAGALTSTSFVNSGLTRLQSTLEVQGASTLADLMAAAVTASSLHVTGALSVDGLSTLADVQADDATVTALTSTGAIIGQATLDVIGRTTLREVVASSLHTGALQADGTTQIGGNLSVLGQTALQGVSAGDVQLGNLVASGSAAITGTLSAGPGQLGALAIGAAPVSGTPLSVSSTSGTSLLRLDAQGVLHIASGIVIDGADASSSTTLGALSVSSFYDQGSASIQGTLTVASATAMQAVTATDLAVQTLEVAGAAMLQGPVTATSLQVAAALNAGSVTTRGLSVTQDDNGNGGNLSAAGITHLRETHTADAYLGSLEVLGSSTLDGNLSVLGGASVALNLGVGGSTTLANLTAAATRLASVVVNGTAQISGALSAGTTTVPVLSIALPASGASATPLSVTTSGNVSLLALDGSGNLTIPGILTVSGGSGGASNLGALTVSSLSDTGNAQISGTLAVQGLSTLASLKVTGASTLAGTTTGALSATSLAVSGATVLSGTLQVTGATTLAALTAAAISAASLTTTGSVTVGTALSVSGSTTLQALTAASLQVASLSVSQDASIGGKLSVAGAGTFTSTLGVSGAATFGSSLNASGTVTTPALVVSLPSSGGSSTPLAVQRADGTSLLSFDTNGNLTITGTLSAAGGQSGSGSANFGDVTVTKLTDTGSASIGTTLNVAGATTLAALSTSTIAASGAVSAPSLLLSLPSTGAAAKPLNLTNSGGTSLLSADASGNLSVGGNLGVVGSTTLSTLSASGAATFGSTLSASGAVTFGSSLVVTGNATAATFAASGVGSASAPAFGYNSSGLYFESLYGQMSESVRGFRTRYLTYAAGRPQDLGAGYLTHQFFSSVSGVSDLAYQFYYNGSVQALSITGRGSVTLGNSTDGVGHVIRTGSSGATTPLLSFFSAIQSGSVASITASGGLVLAGSIVANSQTLSGALSVGGLTTSAGLTLSAGKLTFADGTSLATAPGAAGPSATYSATSAGTAAAPAYAYAGASNGAGTYFDGTGNVLLSVNGFKSLYSTGTGGASGASGWAMGSTLGAGSSILALFGSASTTSPVWSVDGAGAVSAASEVIAGTLSVGGATSLAALTASGLTKTAGLTLTTGSITFADGSVQTTAASGSGGGGTGPSAQYIATALGAASAPAFTNSTLTNTGAFFSGSGTTSSFNIAANGAQIAGVSPTGLTLTSGSITFPDGTVQSTSAANAAAFMPAAMSNYASAWGPPAAVNGQTIPTTTTAMYQAGTSIPHTFTPQVDSALTGAMVVNYNTTGQTVGVFLVDVASGAIVVNLGGQASGAVNAYSYTATQYVLKAGKQYQWSIQRASASGVAYVQVAPLYLIPSATPSSLSYPPSFYLGTSTTVAKNGTVDLPIAGMPTGSLGYYRNAAASFLYYVSITVAGSGQAQFYLYNLGTSANQWLSSTTVFPTLTSTPTTYTYGPFGYAQWPFTPGTNYKMSIYAPNGSLTVTSAFATITVGQ